MQSVRIIIAVVFGMILGRGADGAEATRKIAFAAEDEVIFSGPQPGEGIGALPIRLAYGADTGKEFDPVADANGGPLVLLFLHQPNRPAGNFTRAVLNYCEMFEESGLRSALIYLIDDRATGLEQLQRGASWFGVGVPAGVSLDGGEGPGAYGLNRHVTITVLVANENKVVANFALVQPSLTEVGEIVTPVTKLIEGAFVPSEDQVNYLFGSTHLNAINLMRGGQATRDWRLRAKVMNLIEADNRETLERVAGDIERYTGDDVGRQRELGLSARMLLRQRKPNEFLKDVLERWAKAYAKAKNEGVDK